MPRLRNRFYDVRPRYTPGSPAMVGEEIALKVAQEEQQFIKHALEGVWGEEQKLRAEVLGLSEIVVKRKEVRGGWEVYDVIKDETFFRPSGLDVYLDELNELRIKLRKIRDGVEMTDLLDYWRGKVTLGLDQFLTCIGTNQYAVAYQRMMELPTKELFSDQLVEFVKETATKRLRPRYVQRRSK
jgi:hypothetical protein